MKKKFGINKAIEEIQLSELEGWPTRRLLARLKRLRWCYENASEANDYTPNELASVEEKILFKTDPRWKKAYSDLKTILAKRENVA